MRLATWNVNSLKPPRACAGLGRAPSRTSSACRRRSSPTSRRRRSTSGPRLRAGPSRRGAWNGVAIASRVGIDEVTAGIPSADGWTDDGGRLSAATCGGVRVTSIYAPNGRMLDSVFYREKLDWFERLSAGWRHRSRHALPVCGDHDVAPTDDDVWDPRAATAPPTSRRASARRWISCGLGHGGRGPQFHPETGFFTWWDYRAGHFHKNYGMRIDHVYATPPLAKRAVAAERDRDARKPRPTRASPRTTRRSSSTSPTRPRPPPWPAPRPQALPPPRTRPPPLEELDDLHTNRITEPAAAQASHCSIVSGTVSSSRFRRSSWLARIMKTREMPLRPEQGAVG